jgi:hypothetical protein
VGTGYHIIKKRTFSWNLTALTFTLIFITPFKPKTMNKLNLLIVFILAIVLYSCSDPAITDDLLDGSIFDPSLYNPEQFLVSKIP